MDTSIYKHLLEQRRNELLAMADSDDEAAATVELDQSRVGRLSRMDAMQQQAMANATSQRRQVEIAQAKAALQRITDDEFGYCIECGDDIAPKRLAHNPTAATCITCAKG